MSDAPVPGWYDDPQDPTQLRYWDGTTWTEQVRGRDEPATPAAMTPAGPPAETPAPTPTPAPGPGMPGMQPQTGGMPGMPGMQPTQQTGTPGLAVGALVLGIVSLVLFCCCPYPFSIGAIVMGIIAKKQIDDSGGAMTGGGMAMAGIVCGALGLVLGIVLQIVGAAWDISNM